MKNSCWLVIFVALLLVAPAFAGTSSCTTPPGAISCAGTFGTPEEIFTKTFTLSATSIITIQTWGFGGGTNAAGTLIPSGGFDSLVAIFAGSANAATILTDGVSPIASADNLTSYIKGCGPAGVFTVGTLSGVCGDTTLTLTLAPGTYTLLLTNANFVPLGVNPSTFVGPYDLTDTSSDNYGSSSHSGSYNDLSSGVFQTCASSVDCNTSAQNFAVDIVIRLVKVTPAITWPAPAAITYGDTLSATQLNATAAIPGVFVYNPPLGAKLPVGANQALSVTFTPADTTNYTTAAAVTTITVNPAPPTPSGFVLSYNQNTKDLRSNFTGFVGMNLRVGAAPLTVTSAGRACVAGNSQSHTVKFVNSATGVDVPGGSATVNMAGCTASQFVYAPLSGGSLILQPNTTYYLVSQETMGGDQWYDQNVLTTSTVAAVVSSVYSSGTGWLTNSAGASYVPPNFQYLPVSSGGGGLITGFALNSPSVQNRFDGFLGMSLTVGVNPLSASAVGRACLAGNSKTHTVKLVTAQTGADVAGGSAPVNMVGCTPGQVVFASLSSPVTLLSGATYYLVSLETKGGDTWYDVGQVSSQPDVSVVGAVYQSGQGYIATANANTSYVPPSLLYTVLPPSPQPFVTAYNLNNRPLRSDFTGLIGTALTVGAKNLSVTHLGRICVAGNSQAHTVELINVATLTIVAGAAVPVNMAGCTPGQFVYAPLSSTITITAGTSYYLVSQETQGGDQWYDYARLLATGVATVNNSAYFPGVNWQTIGGPNTSYGPSNFLYEVAP